MSVEERSAVLTSVLGRLKGCTRGELRQIVEECEGYIEKHLLSEMSAMVVMPLRVRVVAESEIGDEGRHYVVWKSEVTNIQTGVCYEDYDFEDGALEEEDEEALMGIFRVRPEMSESELNGAIQDFRSFTHQYGALAGDGEDIEFTVQPKGLTE